MLAVVFLGKSTEHWQWLMVIHTVAGISGLYTNQEEQCLSVQLLEKVKPYDIR